MKRNFLKHIILLIFLFLNRKIAFSQNDTVVLHLVNNSAIQQFALRKMCTTNDGKLWLSSDKGVVSYDGNVIKVFEHRDEDTNSIRFSSIMKCYPDSWGNLYVVTVAMGVDYLDTKTGKAIHLNMQVPKKDSSRLSFPTAYSTILPDHDGTIWAGLYNLGFVHYNLHTKKTECYYLHKDLNIGRNSVFGILQDLKNDEILWLSTEDGIFFFNKKTKELKRNFRCSNPVDSSAQDMRIIRSWLNNPDSIWFAVPGKAMGCYSIKTGSYTIYPEKKNAGSKTFIELNINYLQYKNAEEYYIGSFDSLPGIFNTKTHQYSFASKTSEYLPSKNVNQFLVDRSGNIWCIVWDHLYVAHPANNKFATLQISNHHYNEHTDDAFSSVVWNTKTKNYYAAFDNSDGVYVLDSNLNLIKSITEEVINPAYPATRVLSEGIDKNGRLWMSNINLTTYDSSSGKLLLTEKVFPRLKLTDQRFQNMVFRGDYIYLQPSNLPNHSLYRLNIKTLTYDSILYPSEMIDKKEFNHEGKTFDVIEIDKETKFGYTAYHNNLFQFNFKTNEVRKIITLPDSLKLWEQIFNMFWYKLDDNNHLWVATTKEIMIYEPVHLHLIKSIKLEKDSYILQLYNIDSLGIMCALYSGGVILYDYKNNKQFRLSLSDGLVSETLNRGIACVNKILFVGAFHYLQFIRLENILNRNSNRRCYLSEIKIFNNSYPTDTLSEYLHSLTLPHDKNFVEFTFSSTEYEQPERLEYRYKLEGVNKDWIYTSYLNRTISYNDLAPDSYFFYTSIKNADGTWSDNQTVLQLVIVPAWWQTNWFKFLAIVVVIGIVWLLVMRRIKIVRKQEQLKSKYEKEMLELEAKALRAQMNPHFIFNCMNSIKSLIQQKDEDKAVNYLTTFSKLLRTVLQNSDKREITLYDEIETCKLYTQLESMRFENKFSYYFNVDETIDLKSLLVPALILQPFIENAIWHGIVPNGSGHISLTVLPKDGVIEIIIDDNGMGREASQKNRSAGSMAYQSKGVNLTQSRLKLNNLLEQRQAELEIIDKKDNNGKATGTKVIIHVKEDLS